MTGLFLCFLLLIINDVFGCTKLKIMTSDASFNWINGEFYLEPTLISDGRPVWVENISNKNNNNNEEIKARVIYHFSHEKIDENSNDVENYQKIRFYGRWLLGSNIYSPNAWAYLWGWSIDPTTSVVNSYINNYGEYTDDGVNEFYKDKGIWNIWIDGGWQKKDAFQVKCESKYENNADNDWLFMSNGNDKDYVFNEFLYKSSNDKNDGNSEVTSITGYNIHGFWYRISKDFWRKIESNLFFRINIIPKSDVKNNALYNLLKLKLNIDNIDESKDIVLYSIFYFDDHTESDGTPPLNKIIDYPYHIITYRNYIENDVNWINSIKDQNWAIMNIQNGDTIRTDIKVVMLNGDYKSGLNVYDNFRKYYQDLKSKSLEGHDKDSLITMNNGYIYSKIGLGTGGLSGYDQNKNIMDNAINIGYRIIDSAEQYHSETPLGDIILSDNINRNDLYITTKVWPTDLGFIETYGSLLKSLNRMKTNYIDMYLLHWTQCFDHFDWMDCSNASNKEWEQSWQIMEKLYAEGYLLNIGVSNLNQDDFNLMINTQRFQIIPQLIQNHFDIANQDWEYYQLMTKYGIVLQAYATYRALSQAESRKGTYLTWKNTLNNIAKSLNNGNNNSISPSQVTLKWLINNNIAVIPRTSKINHLKDNFALNHVILSESDMNTLTKGNKNSINDKETKKQEL